MFIQSFSFVYLSLSFNQYSFSNNAATLATKTEQLTIGTPTVDPTLVKGTNG